MVVLAVWPNGQNRTGKIELKDLNIRKGPFGKESDRKPLEWDKGNQRQDCHPRRRQKGGVLPTIPKCTRHGIEKGQKEIGKGGKDHRGLPIQILHTLTKRWVVEEVSESTAQYFGIVLDL